MSPKRDGPDVANTNVSFIGTFRQNLLEAVPAQVDKLLDERLPELEKRLSASTAVAAGDFAQLRIEARDQALKAATALVEELVVRYEPYFLPYESSLKRISDLVMASSKLPEGPAEDVLRAAVVLTHAYLEDFLKSLATDMSRLWDDDSFDGIPLAGLPGRSEKFTLGKLAKYRGHTVDDVLQSSVREYLGNTVFNSTDVIKQWLERMGMKNPDHTERFAILNQMIQRRHQIVHRSDQASESRSTFESPQPITVGNVIVWHRNVIGFVSGVLGEAFEKQAVIEDVSGQAVDRWIASAYEGTGEN